MKRSARVRQATRLLVRASAVAACLGIGGLSVGYANASFTDVAQVSASTTAGVVDVDAGGVQRLTFGGATLSSIGPGASFTQSVTVTNRSTVTVPTASTDIVMWADLATTPTGVDQLSNVLQVRITRAIGGGAATVLYDGSVAGLSTKSSFASSLGAAWRSTNGSSATGMTATNAIYTVTLSLPADATTGAGSSVDLVLVLEARNVTA